MASTTISDEITDLEQLISATTSQIASSNQLTEVQSDLRRQLQAYKNEMQARLDELSTTGDELEARESELKKLLVQHRQRIDHVYPLFDGSPDDLQKRLKTLKEKLTDKLGLDNLNQAKGVLDAVESAVDTERQPVANAESAVDTARTAIPELSTDMATKQRAMRTLGSRIESLHDETMTAVQMAEAALEDANDLLDSTEATDHKRAAIRMYDSRLQRRRLQDHLGWDDATLNAGDPIGKRLFDEWKSARDDYANAVADHVDKQVALIDAKMTRTEEAGNFASFEANRTPTFMQAVQDKVDDFNNP